MHKLFSFLCWAETDQSCDKVSLDINIVFNVLIELGKCFGGNIWGSRWVVIDGSYWIFLVFSEFDAVLRSFDLISPKMMNKNLHTGPTFVQVRYEGWIYTLVKGFHTDIEMAERVLHGLVKQFLVIQTNITSLLEYLKQASVQGATINRIFKDLSYLMVDILFVWCISLHESYMYISCKQNVRMI